MAIDKYCCKLLESKKQPGEAWQKTAYDDVLRTSVIVSAQMPIDIPVAHKGRGDDDEPDRYHPEFLQLCCSC